MTHRGRTGAGAVLRLLVLLAVAAVAGCEFWMSVTEEAPSPAAELLLALESGTLHAADSVPGNEDSTRAAETDSTSQAGAAGDLPGEPGAPGQATAVPGTGGAAAAQRALQERVARLEAVNDSLRATVLGLIALQGRLPEPGGGQGGQASDSASAPSPEAILGAGASRARNWGLRIFFSLVFLGLVGMVIRFVGWVFDQLAERSAQRRLFYKRLAPISRIFLWGVAGLFATLVILDVDASGLVAAGAAGGVALGFASQDILKNVFGGLIVLFDQPFQVGDKISVAGSYGEVVSIGLRSTRIVTPDDNLVTVPNAQVVEGQVANANAGELNCQVVTDLWLPGWVDEGKAKEIAFQAATSSRYVFHNKPIVVLVKDEFERVPLTHLKVKAYVLDPRYEFLFASDVTERARRSFREAGLLPPGRGFQDASPDFFDPFPGARWGATPSPPGAHGNGDEDAVSAPGGSSAALEEES